MAALTSTKTLKAAIASLEKGRDSLLRAVRSLNAALAGSNARIVELEAENRELRAQLARLESEGGAR